MTEDFETQEIEIIVPLQKQPERIDKFLTREIAHISRSRLQQLIELKLVLIDGKEVKSSYSVSPGDKIKIFIPRPKKTKILPEDIPLDILYEDEFLLVINKQAGLVVHPAVGNREGTLVNALLFYCTDLSGINGRLRPGIVHRLDKDTSGLMVVAKDDRSHRHLSEQFSERTIERSYVALVWGHFKKRSGTIESFYGRSPKNRKKMAVLPEGKLAITHFKVLEHMLLLSLVNLKLGTGRTHQIRVHMSHIGHPVFSDYTYGGRNRRLGSLDTKDREFASSYLKCLVRQALHAQTLEFIHPKSKEKMSFSSSIPEDMQKLIDLANSNLSRD